MKSSTISQALAIVALVYLANAIECQKLHQYIQANRIKLLSDRDSSIRLKRLTEDVSADSLNNKSLPQSNEDQMKLNEIDNRILISEPFKSIIQTTARFALAQTKIPKHINLDTAMNFINDAAYVLAKPVHLIKAVKAVVVIVVTFVTSMFFFPHAHEFLGSAWHDPINTLDLDRYLFNGLEQRSVLNMIGSKTDETLARVGLQDHSCRERSLCYLGEIIKCSFPRTSETVTKFTSENFSGSGLNEHIYARAFVSGFVHRNCSRIGSTDAQEASSCVRNFINSLFVN